MGILKTTGIPRMLRLFGEKCSAEIDGSPVEFYGIFDQQNELQTTDGVSVILAGSSLTVSKSIGSNLIRGLSISINGVTWYVREVLMMDDGEIAKVSIVSEASQCS